MLSVLDNRFKEFSLYRIRLKVRLRTLLRKVRKYKNLLFCVSGFYKKYLKSVSSLNASWLGLKPVIPKVI